MLRPACFGLSLTLALVAFAAFVAFVGCSSEPAVRAEDVGDDTSDAASPPPRTDDAGSDASHDVDANPPLRVLFVGNSYTYGNDLPSVVHALGATTPGAAVNVESLTAGGATLEDHWKIGTAPTRIASGDFDAVVLQGQSLEAFGNVAEYFYPYAHKFAGAARDARVRVVWHATWARRAGDNFYHDGRTTPDFTTRSIDHTYRHAAEQWGGTVARVGAAWQLALAELPGVALHAEDGSHPSPAGTLLAACTIFLSLTGREAVLADPIPLGIDRATATALCALAPRVACGPGGCACENARQVATTYDALQTKAPACDGSSDRIGLECSSAMNATCADQPCANAGFGLSIGDDKASLTCVDGPTLDTSFAALRTFEPSCDGVGERYGPACAAAIDQACRATGALSGFGPTSVSGDVVKATCVKPEDAHRQRLIAIGACGVDERWGPKCNTAIDDFCRDWGFAGGFGPTAGTEAETGAEFEFVCVAW